MLPSSHASDRPTAAVYGHQLFAGSTWHQRLLPAKHQFRYDYRYWGINISALARGDKLPEVKSILRLPLFSGTRRALQQFCAADYIQLSEDTDDEQHAQQQAATDVDTHTDAQGSDQGYMSLHQRLCTAFEKHTGSVPIGDVMGLVVCRNAGLYFSPVNFYIGFDEAQTPTHLLAEVSNTPWNKRHYYGFLLTGEESAFCHDKDFHVSPFNPIDQQYCWQVTVKPSTKVSAEGLHVRIAISISDVRGEVLRAGVNLFGDTMTTERITHSLRNNPLMNMTSLARIYWHALKLYAVKRVPYVQYDQTLADSTQQAEHKASRD